MDLKLRGKRALVTGSTGGIGEAPAPAPDARGHPLGTHGLGTAAGGATPRARLGGAVYGDAPHSAPRGARRWGGGAAPPPAR